MTQTTQRYDLEERTAVFGESVIILCKIMPQDYITRNIINQFIRSATSVGANYMEANGASSKKDFRNKIYICKKESRESEHWLRMLSVATSSCHTQIEELKQEAHELVLIFQKITMSLKIDN